MSSREHQRLELYLAHRSALVDYATPILGERARAEDIVQEAFLRFVPRASQAAPALDQPLSYLYRIVRNLAFDTRRRRKNEVSHAEEPAWWGIPQPPRTPEENAAYSETIRQLEGVLAELPMQTRLAVEMTRFGGYTLQEVAESLGVSVATAHRLTHEGLMHLSQVMLGAGR